MFAPGVSAPGGGVPGPRGWGVSASGGMPAPGGCGIPACTEADPTPPPPPAVNRMTNRCKNIT